MALEEYRRKRDFAKTPEPPAKVGKGEGRRYLVQKHAARRLHYDFRLELDGVLLSWAVPKGPSLDPADKRLAVHVEDHPVAYGDFEGVIPEGEYGGGTVLLWDRGTWEPEGDPRRGVERGRLDFRLDGEKLRGAWRLVRMGGRGDDGRGDGDKSWLLVKRRDAAARRGSDVTDELPKSVTSGRTIEQIAADRDAVWRSGKADKTTKTATKKTKAKRAKAVAEGAAALPGARRGRPPKGLRPQLATLVARAPEGDDWLHEVKHDGYRLLAVKDGDDVRLLTRNGKDWTDRFPGVARAVAALPVADAVLDGEVVVLRPDGASDFQALQEHLGLAGGATPRGGVLVDQLFDLPFCDGHDLRRAPLEARKELLKRIVGGGARGTLRLSDHIAGDGPDVLANACRLGLEGIVSKRRDSAYEAKRARTWVKVKCTQRQEVVVGGFTPPRGSRTGFGALLAGVHDDGGRLVYAGKVGTGFDAATLDALHRELLEHRRRESPFASAPPRADARVATWVEPALVAEVAFSGWTRDGRMRHPSFMGLRRDKPAREVVRETPAPAPDKASAKQVPPKEASREEAAPKKASARRGGAVEVAGVRLTHPDRVVYPEQGLTKLDLARYYEAVADHALPHLAGRPLAIVRCPEGREGQCFFQKHLTGSLPPPIDGVDVAEKGGERAVHLMVHDLAGLVALVQMGALEIHPWGSRADHLERPDRLVFDLDPGPGVDWAAVVDAAVLVRERLAGLGLASFVRTTGGKGLHVVVPLVRRTGWDDAKAFARAVAEDLAHRDPDHYVATAAKSRRGGRIFVDYLRNGRGATAVASYSTRARPGAPVATPLAWDELPRTSGGDAYDVVSVPRRLRALGRDPWEGFDATRQSITAGMERELGLR